MKNLTEQLFTATKKGLSFFLLAGSAFLLCGCLTISEEELSTPARTLYHFQCNDGEQAYMSLREDYAGILKYHGMGLKITGRKTESGVKFITSDERIIVYLDKYENITLHILRERSVFCKKLGMHDNAGL